MPDQTQNEVLPVSIYHSHTTMKQKHALTSKSQLKDVDGFDPYPFYKIPPDAFGDRANTYI